MSPSGLIWACKTKDFSFNNPRFLFTFRIERTYDSGTGKKCILIQDVFVKDVVWDNSKQKRPNRKRKLYINDYREQNTIQGLVYQNGPSEKTLHMRIEYKDPEGLKVFYSNIGKYSDFMFFESPEAAERWMDRYVN